MPPQDVSESDETSREAVEIRQDAAITIHEALQIAAEQLFPIGKSNIDWCCAAVRSGAVSAAIPDQVRDLDALAIGRHQQPGAIARQRPVPARVPEHAGEIGDICSKAIGASAAVVLIHVRPMS